MAFVGPLYFDGILHTDFPMLVQQARQKLSAAAFPHHCYVGINCKTNLTFLVLYQACCELNYIPIIMPGIVLDTEVRQLGLAGLIFEISLAQYEINTFTAPLVPDTACRIRVVTRTSGTTGAPRYIAWHEDGIHYQNQMTAQRLYYHDQSKLLVTIPLWSSYGLSLIHLWQAKCLTLVLVSKVDPATVTKTIHLSQATSIDAVPRFYAAWLKYFKHRPLALLILNSVQLYGCGGDFLH